MLTFFESPWSFSVTWQPAISRESGAATARVVTMRSERFMCPLFSGAYARPLAGVYAGSYWLRNEDTPVGRIWFRGDMVLWIFLAGNCAGGVTV
jgi:hypothetical protein